MPSSSSLTELDDTAKAGWRRVLRSVLLPMLLAAAIVIPRSISIARQHNESYDDQYHLLRGLAILQGEPANMFYNDPPLGEAIIALPLWLSGCRTPLAEPVNAQNVPAGVTSTPSDLLVNPLYGQRVSPDTLRLAVAMWKAVLYVPFVGLMFVWCRQLYSVAAGWMVVVVLIFEPTIAAHLPIASLDVLAVEAIAMTCFCLWRYVYRPTVSRGLLLGFATAAAMLIKHTAIILPGVVITTVLLHWLTSPRDARRTLRQTVNDIALVAVVAAVSLWPLTFFQVVKPSRVGPNVSTEYTERWGFVSDIVNPALGKPWPVGAYVGSIVAARDHGIEGHVGFLLDEVRLHGWWSYCLIVGSYKVPLGFAMLMAAGLVSLAWRRLARDEWLFVIIVVAWSAFLMSSTMSIGWRHFLVPYVFLMMFATRATTVQAKGLAAIAWVGVAVGAIHAATFHPNYVAYLNRPIREPWTKISDSNLDWGQSVRQVERWIEGERRTGRLGGQVSVYAFLPSEGMGSRWNLPGDVNVLTAETPVIDRGTLIISPVYLSGIYDARYKFLRSKEPRAVIGSTMLVFDLGEGASKP